LLPDGLRKIDVLTQILLKTDDKLRSKKVLELLFHQINLLEGDCNKVKLLSDLLGRVTNDTQSKLIRERLDWLVNVAVFKIRESKLSLAKPPIFEAAKIINKASKSPDYVDTRIEQQDALNLFETVRIWYKGNKSNPALEPRPITFSLDSSGEPLHLLAFDGLYTKIPYYKDEADVTGVDQIRFKISTKADADGCLIVYYYGYDENSNQIQTKVYLDGIEKSKTSRSDFKIVLKESVSYVNFICWYRFDAEAHVEVPIITLTKYKKK
jgi:hypothetical protein